MLPLDTDRNPPPSTAAPCIGVFDSGVGGLSVLRALRRQLPQAELLYAADSAHAPYGERDPAFILARCESLLAHLRRAGAQMIVVACNTATAVAIEALRNAHPDLMLVGVEPGLKPALALSRNRRIGVMATQGTLASARFLRLAEAHTAGIHLHLQPCPGLAQALETGNADSAEVGELIARHTTPLRNAGVDTVVLGCTHYPFAAHRIAEALGSTVALVDTSEAVARQVQRLTSALPSQKAAAPAQTSLWTSGDPAQLAHIAARWLDFEFNVQRLAGV